MAHTIRGEGPYPDKAGEFCGNHHPDGHVAVNLNQTPQEAERHHREWLAKMRFGKPSLCDAGTSEEMAAKGYVGLYLKEDRKLFAWETPVKTCELQEEHVSKVATP